MIISINEIRQHLRMDILDTNLSDFDIRENEYLEMLYNSALDYINNYLEWKVEENPSILPKSIKSCLLLLIADLYENREAQVEKNLYNNNLVDKMLHLHRKNLGV